MRQLLHPLRRFHLGWAHAFLAAALASLVGLPVAAVLALAWPGPVPGPVLAAAGCATVAACGLPGFSRRWAVGAANRLLGAGLPEPVAARRFSTAAWSLVSVFAGAALMFVSVVALVGLALPVVWLDGGESVTILVPVEVRPGAAGAWTWAVAVGLVAAALSCSAVYGALMRRLAVRLLGPGLAERLAAAEEEARRVASRNRLARELHDAIGHTLTASTIQAAVARQVLETDPESARLALAAIEESSRSALDDLDRALGALREEPAALTAAPTLADLPRLGERVRQAGTGFDLTVDGELGAVPATVSREAYRIVQEGVTNALKHGGGAAVEVRVRVAGERLELAVSNPVEAGTEGPAGMSGAGPGASRRAGVTSSGRAGGVEGGRSGVPGGGRGLAGIAERARLLGGEMTAGPDGSDRWAMRASLPLRSGESAPVGDDAGTFTA
ncbi:sensor histidine kinase [Glycomyces sp. NPDC048151]|uniref:sensor histidine kinase n=1 Tax=Glycomyces sp. NPDC048151 TaxID=3364002 RepID=UPI00372018B8